MVDFEEHLKANLKCEDHEDSKEHLGEELVYRNEENTHLASSGDVLVIKDDEIGGVKPQGGESKVAFVILFSITACLLT